MAPGMPILTHAGQTGIWAEHISIAVLLVFVDTTVGALHLPGDALADGTPLRLPARPLLHLPLLPGARRPTALAGLQVLNTRHQVRVLSLDHVQHGAETINQLLQPPNPLLWVLRL